jgi:hypothetical protein
MEETKICCTCKKELPVSEFTFKYKSKGIRARECKACHKIYNRKWFVKNREERIEKIKARTQLIVEQVKKYKLNLFCKVCGENHISTLDFHHTDPNEKEYGIAVMARTGFSFKRIIEEINKCEVLCANCHRKLHYNIRNE